MYNFQPLDNLRGYLVYTSLCHIRSLFNTSIVNELYRFLIVCKIVIRSTANILILYNISRFNADFSYYTFNLRYRIIFSIPIVISLLTTQIIKNFL